MKLHPHQEQGLEWLRSRSGGAVLADSVGLGKCCQSLALVAEVLAADPGGQVLILVPASLLAQWESELAKFIPTVVVRRHGSKKPADANIVLASHEILPTQWEQLVGPRDLVIVDELSAVGKSSVTVRGGLSTPKALAALREVTSNATVAVGLSATLSENAPHELWSSLHAIGVSDLPPWVEASRWFMWKPSRQLNTGRWMPPSILSYTPDGQRRMTELLGQCLLRRTHTDVAVAIPVVNQQRYNVALAPDQRRAYNQAFRRYDGLRRHQECQSIARMYNGRSALAQAAVRLLLDRVDQLEKSVIFAENLAHLDIVEGLLERNQISFVRIDGSVSRVARADAVKQHAAPKGPRVLTGTSAIERGLNLQHSSLLISLDSSWNPAREEQRAGRLARIGSPHTSVDVVTLLPDVARAKQKVATLDHKLAMAASVGLA